MGRKKRKQLKPWCWYCNREFDDEKILIQHQKAKHFKCPYCHRKLYTGPGLSIHCNQVHKEKLDKIPNSLPNRSSTVIDIYGMAGIPEGDLIDHERLKLGLEDEPPEKLSRDDEPTTSVPPQLLSATLPAFLPIPPTITVGPFIPPVPPTLPVVAALPTVPITFAQASQPKPTFPAYSAEVKADSPPAKVPKPSCGANGVPVELIHPDDDLSLEELRLQSPKYKKLLDLARAPPLMPPAPIPQIQSIPIPPVPHMHPGMMPPQFRMPPMAFGIPAHFMPQNAMLPGVQPMPYNGAPPPWAGMPNMRF